MKVYPIYATLVDVFLGSGWKNWSRVSIKRGRVAAIGQEVGVPLVIAGAQLPDNVLNEVMRRLEK